MANTSLSAFDLSGIVNSIQTHFDFLNTYFFLFLCCKYFAFCPATSNMSATSRREPRHSSSDQQEGIRTQSSAGSESCCLIKPNVVNSKQSHPLDSLLLSWFPKLAVSLPCP